MANRFARRIRSGDIDSVEELKSEFKALAKLSHPDLAGPGSGGEDFARLRQEYEDALGNFMRHRFGARGLSRESAPREGRSAEGPLADEAWACLALLLKRGFPKLPRHEKEALRYEYARWRFEQTLGRERADLFRSCEEEMLGLRAADSEALGPILDLMRDLIDYRDGGPSAMRTQIVLSLGSLRVDPRLGPGIRLFARELALALGIGGEIGPCAPHCST
jgi:hypothetical protein